MTDRRIVYGAQCTWWDTIDKAGSRGQNCLPCCPYCKGLLFEQTNVAQWWRWVDLYEKAGNPGYTDLVKWMRGRCFADLPSAKKAFENSQEDFPKPVYPTPDPDMPADTTPEEATTNTRRLSAEWRQKRQAELDEEREGGGLITLEIELDDALHDLDLADQELGDWRASAEGALTPCADEQHCACVPLLKVALRQRDVLIATLREKHLKFKEQAARVILEAARGPEDDEVLQRAQDEIRALNQPAAQPEEAADG